jgi:hypothetical protein
MTARLPFTQSQVRRAIAAARKAGLRVVGIRPDGMGDCGRWGNVALSPA